MVGTTFTEKENRYDPKDDESVKNFSKLTGIDEEILKNNGAYRNYVNIEQEPNTAFEYKYNNNSLEEIKETTKKFGECLYFASTDDKGYPTNLTYTQSNKNVLSVEESHGINMIPEFCKTYYKNTGHKVVAVFSAYGAQPIDRFLPYDDPDNSSVNHKYQYETMKLKYQSAVKYMEDNNLKIGRKLYVVFQGETNVKEKTSTEKYKSIFLRVHNSLKNDLGIEKGAICETTTTIGGTMESIKMVHDAQEQLIAENDDIILGSSYSYDRYVTSEEDYDNCNTKIVFDENGNKLSYSEAFKKATYSVDYPKNTVHFTSAALSQVGREVAKAYSNLFASDKDDKKDDAKDDVIDDKKDDKKDEIKDETNTGVNKAESENTDINSSVDLIQNKEGDTTIAKTQIPYAGKTKAIIGVVMSLCIMIIIAVYNNNKFKDVK